MKNSSFKASVKGLVCLFAFIASLYTESGYGQSPPYNPSANLNREKTIQRIALGSCAHQDKPQEFWPFIADRKPDIFLFLGDNHYSDTHDMRVLEKGYQDLFSIPGFKRFTEEIPVLAIWDDHDYGWNDMGANYPERKESLAIFRKYFRQNKDLFPEVDRPGVYRSLFFGEGKQRVQVILLDTRYFRSQPQKPKHKLKKGKYIPSTNPTTTKLGKEQWDWLAKELEKPAAIRIIASGMQVLSESHNWESWNNFPHERKRILNLVKNVPGVVFVSGDRHQSRYYRLKQGKKFTYEFTSSSLTNAIPRVDHTEIFDPLAIIPTVFDLNFGLISIDWQNKALTFEIYKTSGQLLNRTRIPFYEIGL